MAEEQKYLNSSTARLNNTCDHAETETPPQRAARIKVLLRNFIRKTKADKVEIWTLLVCVVAAIISYGQLHYGYLSYYYTYLSYQQQSSQPPQTPTTPLPQVHPQTTVAPPPPPEPHKDPEDAASDSRIMNLMAQAELLAAHTKDEWFDVAALKSAHDQITMEDKDRFKLYPNAQRDWTNVETALALFEWSTTDLNAQNVTRLPIFMSTNGSGDVPEPDTIAKLLARRLSLRIVDPPHAALFIQIDLQDLKILPDQQSMFHATIRLRLSATWLNGKPLLPEMELTGEAWNGHDTAHDSALTDAASKAAEQFKLALGYDRK